MEQRDSYQGDHPRKTRDGRLRDELKLTRLPEGESGRERETEMVRGVHTRTAGWTTDGLQVETCTGDLINGTVVGRRTRSVRRWL